MANTGIECKIWSWNVRGINERKKRRSIFRWRKKNRVDICFLQETYSRQSVSNVWRNEWGGKIIWSHGASNARGAAILLRNGLDIQIDEEFSDDSGRLLVVKAKIQGEPYLLINIYAPNDEKHQTHFYRFLKNLMLSKSSHDQNIVLGGDFNLLLDPEMDRTGGNHIVSKNYKTTKNILYDIMEQYNLEDIWRKKNPATKRFTWTRKNPTVKSRLDYWLVSEKIVDNVDTVAMEPSVHSDHSVISIQLKNVHSETKGKGYWKLNNTFINESNYIEGLINGIRLWDDESPELTDPRTKWEFLKYKIRQYSMKYGKDKAKRQKSREENRSSDRAK